MCSAHFCGQDTNSAERNTFCGRAFRNLTWNLINFINLMSLDRWSPLDRQPTWWVRHSESRTPRHRNFSRCLWLECRIHWMIWMRINMNKQALNRSICFPLKHVSSTSNYVKQKESKQRTGNESMSWVELPHALCFAFLLGIRETSQGTSYLRLDKWTFDLQGVQFCVSEELRLCGFHVFPHHSISTSH